MKILHLTLKKKWYDMIASGEKKEEYRAIKPYWEARLTEGDVFHCAFKEFDIVRFRNGYGPNDPTMDVECKGIEFGMGQEEWGAVWPNLHFIIKLGDVLCSTPSCSTSATSPSCGS